MSDEPNKPLWSWIAVVLIGIMVLYVASFGPACWISSRTNIGAPVVDVAYHPLLLVWLHCPRPVGKSFVWYSSLAAADGWMWTASGHWQNVNLRVSGSP
jgi:hypothetical protein